MTLTRCSACRAWIRLLPTSNNPFIVRLALEMMEDSGEYTTVRETNIMPMQSELHTGQPDLHKLTWHQFQYSGLTNVQKGKLQ